MIQSLREFWLRHSIGGLVVGVMLAAGGQMLFTVEAQGARNPWIDVWTNHGGFVIELYVDKAPITAQDFLWNVNMEFYDGLVFHRVIPNFMIQGGAYTPEFEHRPSSRNSPLEADNGMSNLRGTVALARSSNPDSGGSQFFINVVDNPRLDAGEESEGYTVFGRVVQGMDTVDRIANLETFGTRKLAGISFDNVPVSPVIIERMQVNFDRQMEIWADQSDEYDNRRPATAKDMTPPRISLNRAIRVATRSRHNVTGRAIDSSGVAIVEVNGIEAELDADGNFSANILLSPGSNPVTIVAYDIHENRSSETINIERKTTEVVTNTLTTGRYYALLIGVQDYRHDSLNDLMEPLNDARRVRAVLQDTYTFERHDITLLENPDRGGVLDAFDALRKKITPEDSLFIFYAGHGYWDEDIGQGYWLPSDARRDTKTDWIPNSTIQDMIRGIKSKHTLLVSDACFSGGLFKTRSAFSDAPRAARELFKMPSRKAMTSGTLTEVPDVSVFVQYFIKRLHENDQRYLSSQELFTSFRTAVINNSYTHQVPQYGEIRQTGDEGGDFIFVRR